MPIATYNPTRPVAPISTPLPVQPESYQSAVVEDPVTPVRGLLAYVSGSPWAVDYYSQILGRDNDLKDLDYGSPSTYQTYNKLIDLELRVTTALSSSQDEETAIMSVTGSALFYPIPHVIPNAGDVFLARTGDLHQGIYRVTSVERKSFNRDAVYEISYELAFLVDVDPSRFADLEQRVSRVHYFHKERLVQGLNPLIQAPEQEHYQTIRGSYKDLVRYYCQTFFHPSLQTFIIPGQADTIYDPFVVSYLLKIVGILEAPQMAKVRQIDLEKDPYIAQPQFWTALLERRWTILDYANKTMGIVSMESFSRDPMLKGPRYSGIHKVVYPLLPDKSTSSPPFINVRPQTFASLVEADTAPLTLNSPLREQYVDVNQTIPYIHPVLADEHYVLRSSFYERTPSMSLLEALTADYILQRPMALHRLDALVSHAKGWGRLEQYYYLPIVITLVKAIPREPTAP
jgi:hypothetical protein